MSEEPDAPIAVDDFMDAPQFETCLQCGLQAPDFEFVDGYCLTCDDEDSFS